MTCEHLVIVLIILRVLTITSGLPLSHQIDGGVHLRADIVQIVNYRPSLSCPRGTWVLSGLVTFVAAKEFLIAEEVVDITGVFRLEQIVNLAGLALSSAALYILYDSIILCMPRLQRLFEVPCLLGRWPSPLSIL